MGRATTVCWARQGPKPRTNDRRSPRTHHAPHAGANREPPLAINRINPNVKLDTKLADPTSASPFVAGGSVTASYAMGPGATVPNTTVGGGTSANASSFQQVMQQQQAANAQYQAQQQAAGGVPVSTGTDAQAAGFGSVLQQQAAMNMQYLELQNTMQQENQQFSTLSNVLKVRSDTAKNSISNIH